MPVTLVNDFVLIPDPPDWSVNGVAWSRDWQTGITTAVTGDETRQSVRALGRESIVWTVYATSLAERAQLDERLDQASKSGTCCAPFWGRASTLADAVNESADVTLTDDVWDFQPGDYVFLMDQLGNWETAEIESIDPIVLTAPTAGNYPAGCSFWPTLFGKFKMDKESAETSWHGSVKITISELNARHQQTIGTAPASGNGVGYWVVGDTFIVS